MFRYKIKYAKGEDAKRALVVYDGLRRATDTIEKWLDRQLEEFDVTMHQFALLDLLRRRGPLNQVTACAALHDGQSNMAFLASTLEKGGWIKRRVDANDRRNKKLHVTPEGRKLAAILAQLHACLIRAQVSALTPRDQAALARLGNKLADYPLGLVLGELLSLLAKWARE
jgi:DNA-binding MarR family transcriptional regulator